MVLDRELKTFERELPNLLLQHEGEFALIHGDHVDSLWPSEDLGYEQGCERFGTNVFLVKKVQSLEHPLKMLIDVNPSCPS